MTQLLIWEMGDDSDVTEAQTRTTKTETGIGKRGSKCEFKSVISKVKCTSVNNKVLIKDEVDRCECERLKWSDVNKSNRCANIWGSSNEKKFQSCIITHTHTPLFDIICVIKDKGRLRTSCLTEVSFLLVYQWGTQDRNTHYKLPLNKYKKEFVSYWMQLIAYSQQMRYYSIHDFFSWSHRPALSLARMKMGEASGVTLKCLETVVWYFLMNV